MFSPPSDPEFEALHAAAGKIGVEECWTHCSSYCCKTNHPDQQFALMKCDTAGLVYSLAEYAFLERRAVLQEGAVQTARFHEFVFDPARDLRLKFVTTICALGGMCSQPSYRPLICKFYPLYPAPDPSARTISDFVLGSIIDQQWSVLGIEHPCWILREKTDVVKPQTAPALRIIEGHPYLLFYFGAAAMFVKHVAKACRARNLPAPSQDPRQFFRQWETAYLSGALVDVPRLREELTGFYDKLADRFGAFAV